VLVLDWASHLEAVWEQPFVQEFITSLNRYARVLWFDLRGVGLSDRVVEDAVAPEDWMEDVRAVMDSAVPRTVGRFGSRGPGVVRPGRTLRSDPGTARAKMRAILSLDVRRAPTLVIQNRDDVFVRAAHGRYLAEHLPNARLLERDSADHWPLPDADLLGAIEEFVTGSRRQELETERFLTTVLFVDVAGSTERVSAIGDHRWRKLLDSFDETVKETLLKHRCDLVNRAGDGVLATFDGPALSCRVARRGARHENGPRPRRRFGDRVRRPRRVLAEGRT
jgi:hypothetical protein